MNTVDSAPDTRRDQDDEGGKRAPEGTTWTEQSRVTKSPKTEQDLLKEQDQTPSPPRKKVQDPNPVKAANASLIRVIKSCSRWRVCSKTPFEAQVSCIYGTRERAYQRPRRTRTARVKGMEQTCLVPSLHPEASSLPARARPPSSLPRTPAARRTTRGTR